MNVGQIVYNLMDYGTGQTTTSPNDIDIYKNLCETTIGNLSKLGIQAPPGTIALIGTTSESEDLAQEIVIGRNGIFELEEDNLIIKYLSFKRPANYRLDEKSTQSALTEGQLLIDTAYENYLERIDEIKDLYNTNSEEYWFNMENAFKDYVTKAKTGFQKYNQGINGIYISDGLVDLKNIIIDYTS